MLTNFKDFIKYVLVEELHPALQDVIKNPNYTNKSKQALLASTIKRITAGGERTGIEGNMPKGSSRAYLLHEDHHPINIDGKPENIKVGTKVAITAQLDKYHNKYKHGGLNLGAMQNKAEGADPFADKYRILQKDKKNPSNYTTNEEKGIFPPLIDHDHKTHEWTQVGHCRDIGPGEFQQLTKTDEHPKGITHKEFSDTLNRHHERSEGRYWKTTPAREKRMDQVETHPLVKKFMDYHTKTGHPPYDYQQLKNLGVFEHPNGSKHLVARDHGFDRAVSSAYGEARKNAFGIS